MNRALRFRIAPLRLSGVFRRSAAQSLTPSTTTASGGFAHRADAGGAAAASDILTRVAVVMLSSVNAAMWWVYTDSRLMGAVWAIIAISFAVWTKRDVARR